jgi:predicted SAM-dependent methyltransferase
VPHIVVDIGCGDSKYPGAIGIDLFPLAGVDIVADIGRGLPLRDSSVDSVHASHVFEHFDDLVGLMNEIWRVCKPDARLFVTVPHATSSYMTWRDPTHRRGINLSTLTYFDRSHPEGKRFAYYSKANFHIVDSRLRFAAVGPQAQRQGLKRATRGFTMLLEMLANRTPYAQQLCERWWGNWFGVAEAYAELQAIK